MSSEVLDLAIACTDAAEKFIENDPRFEIVGVCVKNSDIFVLKNGVTPKKIGVTQNRKYQEEIVRQRFGEECEVVPLLGISLPYALENDMVDGIMIDVTKGWTLNGEKEETSLEREYVTYVLLVRTDFKEDPIYKKFISLYKKSVEELRSDEVLLEQAKSYVDDNITEGGIDQWRKWKIDLVPITPQTSLTK